MPVERGTKSVTKVVRLLTDPIPQLVSLVEHGANQTPFKVVKTDAIKRDLSKDTDMAGMRTRSVKDAGKADLHKMVFKTDHFKDEGAVKKYLDDNGYTNYEITVMKSGDFEVLGHEADKFEGDVKMVSAAKGLTMWVGVLKADTTAAETTEEPAKAAKAGATVKPEVTIKSIMNVKGVPAHEVAQKFSAWVAEYTGAKTMAETLRDGDDGTPIGFYDVMQTFVSAFRNIMTDEDVEDSARPGLITALGGELSTVLNALNAVFDDIADPAQRSEARKASTRITVTVSDDAHRKEEPVKTEAEKAAEAEAARKAKATAEDGDGKVTAETGDKGKKEGTEGDEGREGAGKEGKEEGKGNEGGDEAKKAATEGEPAKKNTGEAEQAATGAPSWFTEAMAPLTAAVKGVQDEQSAQSKRMDTISESVSKTVERLDTAEEGRAQTRKSSVQENAEEGTRETPAPREVSMRSRNLLGMRRRA